MKRRGLFYLSKSILTEVNMISFGIVFFLTLAALIGAALLAWGLSNTGGGK